MKEPKIHLDEVRMSNFALADASRGDERLENWVDVESLVHVIDKYVASLLFTDHSLTLHDALRVAFAEGFLLGVRFQDAGGKRPDDRKRR